MDDYATKMEACEKRITEMERRVDVIDNTRLLRDQWTSEEMVRIAKDSKKAIETSELALRSVKNNTRWYIGGLISLFLFLPPVIAAFIKLLT